MQTQLDTAVPSPHSGILRIQKVHLDLQLGFANLPEKNYSLKGDANKNLGGDLSTSQIVRKRLPLETSLLPGPCPDGLVFPQNIKTHASTAVFW